MVWKPILLAAVAVLACGPGEVVPAAEPRAGPGTALPLEGVVAAREIEVFPSWSVGAGSAVVLRPAKRRAEDGPRDLIVHFHGAVAAVRGAMERDHGRETVLLINMPGLSGAYERPFRDEPTLFQSLLTAAWDRSPTPSESKRPPGWRRITLSCFSAGYGAVREILRSPDRGGIDAIVAADSIYAGVEAEGPGRRVSAVDMAGFLAFARRAVSGRQVFVIAHSAQPTPYASTTETSDYLLAALGIQRAGVIPATDVEFAPVSRCRKGGLLVTGYAGESAAAHLHHLRVIESHWADARKLASRP